MKAPSSRFDSLHIVPWIIDILAQNVCLLHKLLLLNLMESVVVGVTSIICCMIAFFFLDVPCS